MKSRIYVVRIISVLAVAFVTLRHVDAQDNSPKKSRLVWAAKPITPIPFEPPNRLIWRLSEILAAHKGQANWRQPVVKTRDIEADWISMAPGEKTKTVFYADDRVFWVVESGLMRVIWRHESHDRLCREKARTAPAPGIECGRANIEGQQLFVAKKGFLVQAAPRLAYSMETVGNEPALRFEVRPAGEMPSLSHQ